MAETIQKKDEANSSGHSYGLNEDLSKELLAAISNENSSLVKELLEPLHAADIADFIDAISHDQRKNLIHIIRDSFDPEILVDLDYTVREEILDILGTEHSASAIKSLDKDDAVDIMENLEEEDRKEIFEAMPDKHREMLEEGLSYLEDSAGRLIEENIVSIPEFWTVGQTIDYLRASKNLPDSFYQVFVVDPKLVPVGGVMVSKILRATRSTPMKDIMYTDLKVIHADMDQEEVAFIFRQYGLASAPVVNDTGRMIGVIELNDIIDVIEEEAQEDILRLGGIKETDIHTNTFATLFSRFPWLFLNLGTAFLAATVIGFFDGAIAKITTLAVLMPVAASMGGNAGTQSFTVIVRALATKELSSTNFYRVVSKEILVGLLNGLFFALITGLAAYLWFNDPHLSIIFGCAIILTLLMAGIAGALVPIFLEKIGVDPAISSGIILTTITDCTAFATFLGFATIFLL